MIVVREATATDAPGIARVHVDSWRTTYKGMMPDSVINSHTYESRTQMWSRALNNPDWRGFMYVAEDKSGQIVGFASGGPAREYAAGYDSELTALYLLQEYQGKGIGKRLFWAVVRRLEAMGFRSILIWVLAGNEACGFYEKMGGRKVREMQETVGDFTQTDYGYGWSDLAALMES